MSIRILFAPAFGFVLALALVTQTTLAQSMSRLTLEPWPTDQWLETLDHPIIQSGGHINTSGSASKVFWWDSYGRARFDKHDDNSPFVAYRLLTIDAGTNSNFVKSTMDDLAVGFGFHLGEIGEWDASAVVGGGYNSTHPFVNSNGAFGLAHLMIERPLTLQGDTSLVLGIDYQGDAGLLPDAPLPGFAIVQHGKNYRACVGFPDSSLVWEPMEKLQISAKYGVPFSAEIDAEYRLAKHFGCYANAANFFQGFAVAGQPLGNRQYYQMRRIETGVRVLVGKWIDASIGVGYAFDQGISRGFDVRDIQGTAHLSNQPYLVFVIRGAM